MVYDIFKSSLWNIWPSLIITVVTIITVRFAYLKNHHEHIKYYREFWTLIGIIYMLLLYQMVTRVDLNYVSGVNLIPFKEILRYNVHSDMFLFNVFGNIALFIPFGFIIAIYIKPKGLFTNTVIAILVSFTIELVQLRIGRSFDIDDIILNTIGCIIGFLLYVGFNAIENHLPKFLKSDWFNNLICIIITICVAVLVMRFMGIVF